MTKCHWSSLVGLVTYSKQEHEYLEFQLFRCNRIDVIWQIKLINRVFSSVYRIFQSISLFTTIHRRNRRVIAAVIDPVVWLLVSVGYLTAIRKHGGCVECKRTSPDIPVCMTECLCRYALLLKKWITFGRGIWI